MILLLIFLFSSGAGGTFSIAAMDSETGEFGVAVSSKVFDVGYIVPWLKAGTGAVATQASSNPYYGPWALEALSDGKTAEEALKLVLSRDSVPEERQVGIVDKYGNSASHTGKNTLEWAGHRNAQYVSVQGNILTGPGVVDSMFNVFQRTEGPLGERLLSALEAGEEAGGDRRGKQSAALYVVLENGGYQGVDDRLIELKVVDNEEPVRELRRQYEQWQFGFMAAAYLRLIDEKHEKREVFLDRAHSLLEEALESDIQNASIYNSLAWQFALMRKYPEETLRAAEKAHDLEPEDPNIMDTYAEAFYAAGRYEKAVEWEKKALEMAPENEFFKKQLEKFIKAREKK